MAGHSRGVNISMELYKQMNVAASGFWKLFPKNEPDYWRSTILPLISWLISFDFPMMSHKDVVCLRCTSNQLQCCQLIRSFQSHDIIVWAFLHCLVRVFLLFEGESFFLLLSSKSEIHILAFSNRNNFGNPN